MYNVFIVTMHSHAHGRRLPSGIGCVHSPKSLLHVPQDAVKSMNKGVSVSRCKVSSAAEFEQRTTIMVGSFEDNP